MKLLLLPGVALMYAAMFQMPATPPMKMGLWESTSQIHMEMGSMPSFMAKMMNRTYHVKSCVTPESYQKWMVSFNQQQKACVRSNEVYADHKYTADTTCNDGRMTSHTEMFIDSDTSIHGTTHINMTDHGATGDSTTTTTWLGADCGSISPEKPQIIK